MRPVSDDFLTTIRGSHQLAVRCRVLTSFQTGVNPTGGAELDVIDGEVRLDGTADVRGACDVTAHLADYDFTRDPTALLTPYGNELFIERGVTFATGNRELVSLGYFRLDRVEQTRRPGEPLRLTGRDRMIALVDFRSLTQRVFVASTTLRDVIEPLVTEVYPAAVITYDFDPDAVTLGGQQVLEEQQTYHDFIDDLVRSRGKIMYWNHRGELTIRTAPDATTPVFTVNAGRDGVLVTLDRELDREGVYNAVLAAGEAPDDDPPVRGIARDNDPASPTYWGGRFGKVPRFYFSSFLRSNSQAENAAVELLKRSIGLPYRVSFEAVVNPALEPLDPVRVEHAGGYEVHVLERLTVPLTADGALDAETRELTSEVIETGEEA